MASLKAFLPKLGECLRVSPLALYERQRALVRLGILTGERGRGPGSGVKLTADTLAALLTSLLITDNLSEVDDRVGRLLKAKLSGHVSSPRTKAKARSMKASTFGAMLSHVLSSSGRHWAIRVDRQTLYGNIYDMSEGGEAFVFGLKLLRDENAGVIETEAALRLYAPSPLLKAFQSAVTEQA